MLASLALQQANVVTSCTNPLQSTQCIFCTCIPWLATSILCATSIVGEGGYIIYHNVGGGGYEGICI